MSLYRDGRELLIEHKSFTRLGGRETLKMDVRIIAATNAPIEKMVSQGLFRRDIFYRLNEYAISMPRLRDRREDIPLLVKHFCQLYGGRYGRPDIQISPVTLSRFTDYRWPGNVRELESAIRRIALEGEESNSLPPKSKSKIKSSYRPVAEVVQDTESQVIFSALSEARWNRRKAAKMLRMSYSSLRRRIEKYGLRKQQVSAAKRSSI